MKPEQVADLVKKDYIEAQKELFGALDGDLLLEFLGDDVASKIRKSDLKRIKKDSPKQHVSKNAPKAQSKEDTTKKLSKEDWLARLEEMKR